MSKPAALVLDTLDDRREIATLLAKLPPGERVAWLAWCCRQVPPRPGMRPQPARRMAPRVAAAHRCGTADERLTTEVYFDAWALAHAWKLDLGAAAEELERRVRRYGSAG